MPSAETHSGGCQCGKVRYEIDALENSHVCHCRMCQRATGGLFAALVGAPKAKFRWTQGKPAMFKSSNLATRPYCKDCGTPLGFTYNDPDARMYVTIGSLDMPENAKVLRQYGAESKLPFVEFCENLPQEATDESEAAAEFFKALTSNQSAP